MPYSSGVNGLPESEVERQIRQSRSRYSSGVKRDPKPAEEEEEKGFRRARGTGFNNRKGGGLPEWLQGRQIGRGTRARRDNRNTEATTETPTEEQPVRPSQPTVDTPTAALEGSTTRTNSKGVEQTGKSLGYRSTITKGDGGLPYIEGEGGLFDRLGLGPGVKMNTGWASNQLFGTDTALYSGKPVTREFGTGNMQLNTGAEQQQLSKNLFESGGAVEFSGEGLQDYEPFGEKPSKMQQSSGAPGGMTEEQFNLARRRAFLDAPNAAAGMRAVDALHGRVRAGGDYYYTNPNAGQEGESEFIKVDTNTARQHSNGQITGQELLAKHMDKIKGQMPAESIVEGEFTAPPADTPTISQQPADRPAASEFSPDMTADFEMPDEDRELFSKPRF